VVLADVAAGTILAADRVPTGGPKGGAASLDRAARLVRRLVAAHGGVLDGVAVAPLRPIATTTATVPEPPAATGRLWVGTPGPSAGAAGVGFGAPFPIGSPPPDGPVVALIPADRGFRSVLGELRGLADRGVLAAVVLERDEAVLVANRLPAGIPVVDELAVAEIATCQVVAVEVRSPLRAVVDPLWLAARLGLPSSEQADAARVAARLYDRTSAVVAVTRTPAAPAPEMDASVTLADGSSRAVQTPLPPGLVRAYRLPGEPPRPVDDLFAVDLGALADGQVARAGAVASRTIALAALHADAPYADPGPELSARLGVPARTSPSEAAAARLGALSTPGAPDEAVVVDLGAGTIDIVTASGERVLAGAGELLTAATAAVLGTARTPRRVGEARPLPPGRGAAAAARRGRHAHVPGRADQARRSRRPRGARPGRVAAVRPAARAHRVAGAAAAAQDRDPGRQPRPRPLRDAGGGARGRRAGRRRRGAGMHRPGAAAGNAGRARGHGRGAGPPPRRRVRASAELLIAP
jgi:hypothetical protein